MGTSSCFKSAWGNSQVDVTAHRMHCGPFIKDCQTQLTTIRDVV